jgi:DNA polymerase-3 subunit beta
MKITVSKETLLKPLQTVCGVVEKRQTLPVLSNVMLTAKDNQLVFTGTDLEVEMMATVSATVEEPGEITIPAKKLLDIWKNLPDGKPVTFSLSNNHIKVKCDQSKFSLTTLPTHDFPVLDEFADMDSVVLKRKELKRIIEKTQFAMAVQDVRYYLLGLLLELTAEGVRAVATDGHRLAMAETFATTGITEKKQMIIPRKSVLELLKILDDSDLEVKLDFGTHYLRTEIDDVRFTSKLIDGRYPDYQRAIPESTRIDLVLEKTEIKQALQRAAILSNDKLKGVKLSLLPDLLTVQAHNPEQEEAEDKLAISYAGPDLALGFNVNYLLDAIAAIGSEQVHIGLNDEKGSALITGTQNENCRYVVMPMNI